MFLHNKLNTTIVTPNDLLASILKERYENKQVAESQSLGQSLQILSLAGWLETLWNTRINDHNDLILLNNFAEFIIWQNIVQEKLKTEAVFNINSIVRSVQESWRLVKLWQVDTKQISLWNEDGQALLGWFKKFEQICSRKKWLARDQLPTTLALLAEKGHLQLPQEINFYGFQNIPSPPQITNLLNKITALGNKINFTAPNETPKADLKQAIFENAEQEIESIGRWAKLLLTKNPKATIGIADTDLRNRKDRIAPIFAEIFEGNESVFHFALDVPISDYPLVNYFLNILQLFNQEKVSQNNLRTALCSPYAKGYAEEKFFRASLANLMQENLPPHFSLRTFLNFSDNLKHCSRGYFSDCPLFTESCKQCLSFLHKKPKLLTPQQFIEIISHLLDTLSSPKTLPLMAEEHHALLAWQELLAKFMHLGPVNIKYNFAEFLKILEEFVSKENYTLPYSCSPARRIYIIDALEAVGLNFDYLWIMNASNLNWPPSARANPFIPISLQKKLGLPLANLQGEYTQAKTLTDYLKKSASKVTFSFAKKDGDKVLEASSFIKDVPTIKREELLMADFIKRDELIFNHKEFEICDDNQGPALLANENIHGGSRIISCISACPFRSFAEIRMHLKSNQQATLGLTAKERGILIHDALLYLWQNLQSQQKLINLSEIEIKNIISKAIENASSKFDKKRTDILPKTLFKLEKIRTFDLLLNWLEKEKKRAPFVIKDLEKNITFEFSSLKINLKIDRVDVLNDDNLIIIDYKTGKTIPLQNDWLGERPNDTQLPLYAIVSRNYSNMVRGLAYAKVNSSNMIFSGITENDGIFPQIRHLSGSVLGNVAKDFDSLIQYWQKNIERLLTNFINGDAKTDPLNKNETCRHCHLASLCRIYEKDKPL